MQKRKLQCGRSFGDGALVRFGIVGVCDGRRADESLSHIHQHESERCGRRRRRAACEWDIGSEWEQRGISWCEWVVRAALLGGAPAAAARAHHYRRRHLACRHRTPPGIQYEYTVHCTMYSIPRTCTVR